MKLIKKKIVKKINNIKLFIGAKITTYKIRWILLRQMIKQRSDHSSFLNRMRESFDLSLIKGLSKPDNATAFFHLLLPFYLLHLSIPYMKQFVLFWYRSFFYEFLDILNDIYCGIRKIIFFPWRIYKAFSNFVNTPWDYKKIIEAIKIPISIRLYRAFKKYIWMPIWKRIDYDWFSYMLSLYLVNYNYMQMGREERWYSYDHQPASWDYNWLTILH